MFLSETIATSALVERLKCKWNLNGISVDKIGRSGGLALLWRKDVNVTLLSFSQNHIDASVLCPVSETTWRCTGFYGFADHTRRDKSWALLRHLQHGSSLPWLVGCDFNEILTNEEKFEGNDRQPGRLAAFRETLVDCMFTDIGFTGSPYTWSNNRIYPDTLRCRLDRCCATTDWRMVFPTAQVQHLDPIGSDHNPLLLVLNPDQANNGVTGKRPFRLEALWIQRKDCETLIQDHWAASGNPNPSEGFLSCVDECRLALISWNRTTVRERKERIEAIKARSRVLTSGLQTEEVVAEIHNLRDELEKLYEEEDTYWKQRSRIQWMVEGDRNTSFFHSKATARKKTNSVKRLMDSSGVWREGQDMKFVVAEYFEHFFQSTNPSVDEIDEVLEQIEPRISGAANRSLDLPFTSAEVTRAISQMAPLKSPGPDGLPVLFYKKYWHIIGDSTISCVLNFLNNRIIPSPINATFLVLIPKIKNPEKVSDFRPISLCNVVYKISSKMIANRLKPLFNDIISPTQSAFVPKRLITDNVLVAFEINHYIRLNHNKRKTYMAIKLDISKAYDRVEWLFLEKILLKFGFSYQFVDIIMLCVKTVSFSFLLNGKQFGSLMPARGLRQGDPLSPYLFICCTEALTSMLYMAVRAGRLHGIKIAPSAPCISNLCFADDTLLFCEATVEDATSVKRILERYARVSGQEINLAKSTVAFCHSTAPPRKDQVAQVLGFNVVDQHEKYLGLPATMGRTKKEVFSFLRDRIWNKIKGWGERQLSRAGKEVLIKSVLQGVPSYVMSCFKLPQGILHDLESAIRQYWWNSGKKWSIAWISWSKLCRPKNMGGMGFRDLTSFNLAMLAKQAWRLHTQPDSLFAQIFKAKYYPRGSVFSADVGTRPSLTWRSIREAIPYLERGLRSRIESGTTTAIWADRWLMDDDSRRIMTRQPQESAFPDSVADLIDPDTHNWNKELIDNVFWPVDRDRILAVPIGGPHTHDRMIWHYSAKGNFSVRSCYHLILSIRDWASHVANNNGGEGSSDSVRFQWRDIWKLSIPPKMRTFLWRACTETLPTAVELFRRKITLSPFCSFCGTHVETATHALNECSRVRGIWLAEPFKLPLTELRGTMWAWIADTQKRLGPEQFTLAIVVMWRIWENRNRILHGETENVIHNVTAWSTTYLATFQQILKGYPREKSARHPSTWTRPPAGIVKINVDASFPSGETFYGISMVAHDENGKCLWWNVSQIEGRPQVADGEALAVLQAVRMAATKGWNKIIVEGDNLSVMTTLQTRGNESSSFGAIAEECLVLANSFRFCNFQFIKRTGNSIAHTLVSTLSHVGGEGVVLPSFCAGLA